MSSSVSPISSLSSGSSTTAYFSGMSSYSQSLNQAIEQEVEIASLPIQILQNDVTTLSSQQTELQTLSTDMSSVQSAISSLASAAGNMLSATVSDPSVASVTVGSGATAASYSLAVGNLGSYSDALSIDGLPTVTDPTSQSISTSAGYSLTVGTGTQPVTITPSGNNLDALAQAINQAKAGVQATIVNVGSSTAPDYRLSLQSDQLGDVSMQLYDGATNLLAASGEPGQQASYTIDGHSVKSPSDTVTLAPGVTVNLTGTTNSTATITVAADVSSVAGALQSFVSAYNSAITELNKNVGQSGGALAGQSVVYELLNGLQGLANYTSGSGAISSMAALGLTFNDTSGQLSFDQSTFDSVSSGQTEALASFLGSSTGGGFLELATNVMSGIEDSTTGILSNQINTIQSQITNTNTQISDKETQVSRLQTNLTNQMSAADATIYQMQQQASYLQQMFTAQTDAEAAGLG